MTNKFFTAAFIAIASVLVSHHVWAVEPTTDGAKAATAAMSALRVPEGFAVELFASDPQLANPVAFCLDEQGRVFVAEEHRFLVGTPENRTHGFLLDDDLQVNTLADREAMQAKWADRFDKGADWFTQKSDIVRQLVDTDGDGRADRATVFADGFNGPLDGLGSGVIAKEGQVWFTCIPSLWLLRDEDNDGRADVRISLLEGFGVNAAFYGHDLHGLVWGVDGKLYFSVGDRGAHVVTKEGTTISNPRRGAVYRCNPDGTQLELVHQGLRNPQELAVDQYGNLFADDNNCDKGDHSRLVYVVPGGDSGWNMEYQHIPEPYLTGPWHAEAIWHLHHELQPAYIVPPIGKLGAGPSGFVFSSGTSLPSRYRNHFFYCNFTSNGGIESFAVEPQGAGFTIVDHHDFCKPVMASDVDFGYDGKMYFSDYPTSPWDRTSSGGRIYTVFDKDAINRPVVTETKKLFQEGFGQRSFEQLVALLHHDDMRVRLRSQFTLASRGSESAEWLIKVATDDGDQLARLHAIWGLGQIGSAHSEVLAPVVRLLDDPDSEVRAQAARVLGEARYQPAASALVSCLSDDAERVRFFAALALGSLEHKESVPSIINMLRNDEGRDRQLAHAGVVALERIGDRKQVQRYASDSSVSVRMAVLLTQRRWRDPRIAQFLNDVELKIVTEAARAIHDLPIPSGRKKLARLTNRYVNASSESVVPLMRRVINANLQRGDRQAADAVVQLALGESLPVVIRREAISALGSWKGGTTRDRVTGFWRPIAPRDDSAAREAVQPAAAQLLASVPEAMQAEVAELLSSLQLDIDDRAFAQWVVDSQRPVDARIAALRLLSARNFDRLQNLIDTLLESDSAELRIEARDLLADRDEERATFIITKLLDDPATEVREKQCALTTLARLATLKSPRADQLLDAWATRLVKGEVPLALQLDLIDTLAASTTEASRKAIDDFQASIDPSNPLAAYQVALEGGDAKRGRQLFFNHAGGQCIRCHMVQGQGGNAGPDLSLAANAARLSDRRHLLESIMMPSAKIAEGFGTVTLLLATGQVVAGTVKHEDEATVTLITAENKSIRIDRDTIEEQSATKSAMPEMKEVLTLRELRDLVEYLATLKPRPVQAMKESM